MNLVYMFLEIIFTFFLLFMFYKIWKKDGLYLYLSLLSAILSVVIFEVIDLFSFQINLGIPIVMGIFIVNNIIIQRFGIDEVRRIMLTTGISYVMPSVILSLLTLCSDSGYTLISNALFNGLFGYNVFDIRTFIGGFSIVFMLWVNSYFYYYIRRSKNVLWVSNVVSSLIIQMLESIIFVVIAYLGDYSFPLIFGMIVIRYLCKIIISLMGIIPIYMIVKMRDR